MKKRHKALIVVGAGALVYGLGILMGVSFLGSQTTEQIQEVEMTQNTPSYVPQEAPENISKWLAEIHPAAGEEEKE